MNLKGFFSEHLKVIHFSWRRVWIGVVAIIIIGAIFFVGALVYAASYTDKVLPGVYLGDIYIGGMERSELTDYLQAMQSKLSDSGINFRALVDDKETKFIIYPTVINDENVRELISYDVGTEVDYLVSYRKNDSLLADAWSAMWVKLARPHLGLSHVSLDKAGILEQIHGQVSDLTKVAQPAGVKIFSVSPLQYELTSSTPGVDFNFDQVASQIVSQWSHLQVPEVVIKTMIKEPAVLPEDVESIIERLPAVFAPGQLDVIYTDPVTKRDYIWYVSSLEMAAWLEVQNKGEGEFVFGLSEEKTSEFLQDDIAGLIEVEPRDAKFRIGANNKVVEFQNSRPGVTVDVEKTYAAINEAIIQRTLHDEGVTNAVTVINKQVEPKVKTGEVNDLGISEVLGVGHSKFRGSPANRIKNIRHAAFDKLNGLLIKPGEEFSLIQALQPFTTEDGYLPELVIKGDKIIPELGGGLCQIGTTMFRATMNSGLPITERRNHSLVVPYYNDLTNGNPGTDATIYEPHPDLRFVNDTGNYILITAEVNVNTSDLYFYFWGTGDGRQGSYNAPTVLQWIPAGEDRIIETTELEVGEEECQAAHIGAVATFTYTRVLPDGEKIDRVFESYYRPLPKICLLGVEEETCAEGEECEGVDEINTDNNTSTAQDEGDVVYTNSEEG